MAVKTKTQLKADNDSEITTNGNGDITGAVLNSFNEDIIDSFEDFIPTYTTAQINALVSPATRMIVYDSDEDLFKFYTGTQWVRMNSPKCKVYIFSATQTGTNAPTVTVYENTLGGDVVWSYNSTGKFRGTLAGAFTALKTVCPQDQTGGIDSNTDDAYYIYARRNSNDTFDIFTRDNTFSPANGLLQDKLFQIFVYY